jgi:hypothetical protein
VVVTRFLIRAVRWWFSLTYLAAGVGALVAGPIMIGLGNYGGLYMIVAGPLLAAMGWALLPRKRKFDLIPRQWASTRLRAEGACDSGTRDTSHRPRGERPRQVA